MRQLAHEIPCQNVVADDQYKDTLHRSYYVINLSFLHLHPQ